MNHASYIRIAHLAAAHVLRLSDGPGTLVKAERGRVWITQEGDGQDVILQAGESHLIDRDGLVLAMPLGGEPAVVRIASAASLPIVA